MFRQSWKVAEGLCLHGGAHPLEHDAAQKMPPDRIEKLAPTFNSSSQPESGWRLLQALAGS